MLVLSRKPGEEVAIGDNIRLTVVGIRGKKVRLGLTVPREMPIRRQELRPSEDTRDWPCRAATDKSHSGDAADKSPQGVLK